MTRRTRRPTLEDVAKMCGVSKGTVNRAIHGKPGISPVTKQKVLAAISEIGFQPNHYARSLATGRTESIGVLLPNVDNEFFAMVCSQIEEMCWQRGYVMNLSFSNDRPEREEAVIRSLVDRNVDGLIVFPVSKDRSAITVAIRRNTPVVLLLNDLSISDASVVVVNEHSAMTSIVQHLVDLGHRRIAYVNGYLHYSETYNDYINRERLRGYRDALAANRVARARDLVVEFGPELYRTRDYAMLRALATRRPRPTAIVCFHDQIAIWVLQGLERLGLRVPKDISVTGFDDIRELEYIHPRLTTCAIPTLQVAAEALRVLFGLIDRSGSHERVVIDAALVTGESTTRAPMPRGR